MSKPYGWAAVPGSCGELVQGIYEGRHFHVTCPVDLYSRAVAVRKATEGVLVNPHSPKAARAVEGLLERFRVEGGFELFIDRDMSVGKGMASSTADIAAACWAVADALNLELSAECVAEAAVAVEPTDGVLFPGIVAFDHVQGGAFRRLDYVAMDVVIIEPPSTIDTLAVAANRPRYAPADLKQIEEAYAMVVAGLADGDEAAVAAGATLSASVNQRYFPKRHFEEISDLAARCGALGLNVAHSGTVMGVLAKAGRGKWVMKRLAPRLPKSYAIRAAKLIPGGPARSMEQRMKVERIAGAAAGGNR